MNKLLAFALENINGICVVVGAILMCHGVRAWSPPAAWLLAGLCLVVLGLWPYLRGRGSA